jgi:uncharacterized protein YyaL (SSP411 family)
MILTIVLLSGTNMSFCLKSYLVGKSTDEFVEFAPVTRDYSAQENETTIYVCENFVCNKPTSDGEAAFRMHTVKK